MSKFLHYIFVLILCLAMSPSAYAQGELPRTDPALLQLALHAPDQLVAVIVQRQARQQLSAHWLRESGAEITKELSIINAFVAKLPARGIETLARAPGVRWISQDAPVKSTQTTPGFGELGVIKRNYAATSAAFATTVQSDGKVVVAGTASNSGNDDIVLTRFNSDGTPDLTFGTSGSVITKISANDDRSKSVVLQSDGKIIVVGNHEATSNFDFIVVRYNSNGSLDTTFSGDGSVTINIFGNDYANGALIQADGKIVVVGRDGNGYLAMVRLNSNGTLDSTFDGNGIEQTNLVGGNTYGMALGIQADGKLLLAGTQDFGAGRSFDVVVARYNSNGSLDTTFDGDGIAVKQISGGADRGNALVIQSDGKIVVAGVSFNGTNFDIALLRFNSNGSLDTTFSGDGLTTTPINGDDYAYTVAMQSDGKIVVAGATHYPYGNIALLRYSNNGNLDTTFNGTGYVVSDIGGIESFSYAMRVQADGKITLAGSINTDNTIHNLVVLRYTSQGKLDLPISPFGQVTRVTQLRSQMPSLEGQGITVAVVDSGIGNHGDLKVAGNSTSRVTASFDFTGGNNTNDGHGHGTHVAGILGGNGAASGGINIGVAPKVNLLNLKVSNDQGASKLSDVIAALQWINNNRSTYNIRVVNLSLNSTVAEAYHVSPLNAAVEILWFNRIVVVVSAGNNGTGTAPVTLYPPANDPFVITVGAADSMGTIAISDDTVATFSAYGVTENGFAKPDLVAPGRNIISLLASTSARGYQEHRSHRIDNSVFRMSGTSMATPVVAGAVALLLQDEPNLSPDQVKYRLKATANTSWAGYNTSKAGAGYLDVYAAVTGTTTQSANTYIAASQMLFGGSQPVVWNSVNWNSVNWNSVNWNSVNWNSVNWNSGSGSAMLWGSVIWDEEPVRSAALFDEETMPTIDPTGFGGGDESIEGGQPFVDEEDATALENSQQIRLFLPLVTN